MRSTLKNCKTFFGQFLFGEKVGSVMPSSKGLALKMVKGVDFEKAKVIVELGPGTGAITKYIVPKLKPDTKLISIEINEVFVKQLNEDYPQENVEFICDSVENIPEILKERGIEEVDAYISSLPISIFPKEMTAKLTQDMIDTIADDGRYVQYQYSLHKRKWIEANWQVLGKAITVLNVPPSIVYTCKKKA